MKIGNHVFTASALSAALGFFLCLCAAPAVAQTKPPESTSKVKKVLLYNKVGGWLSVEGNAAVKGAFSNSAAAKGFELVQLGTDIDITLDYLKQFQVIVWNNNTNGGLSMPSLSARQAVFDYLDQGGGWMLIGMAADHSNTWPGLAEALGTNFTVHAKTDLADVVLDSAAKAHKELKWMVTGLPDAFRLDNLWLSFKNTVRPLPGVTVVATARGIPGVPDVVVPLGDSSEDHPYIWARQIGKGRLIYNAIGYLDNNKIMEQQDSIVPKVYWENLRYAAGDYQNGCTDPASPGFDPAARVHVEGMCPATGLRAAPALSEMVVSRGGLRMRIETPDGPFHARLRDLRGALVWERTLPAGTREIPMEGAIRPGVYQFEILGAKDVFRRRLMLP